MTAPRVPIAQRGTGSPFLYSMYRERGIQYPFFPLFLLFRPRYRVQYEREHYNHSWQGNTSAMKSNPIGGIAGGSGIYRVIAETEWRESSLL